MSSSCPDLAAFAAAAGIRDAPGVPRRRPGAGTDRADLRQGCDDRAAGVRPLHGGPDPRWPDRRVLPVPRHRGHARGAQSRRPAVVRRVPRSGGLRHDPDPAAAVRRVLPAPDRAPAAASRRAGGGRHQRAPHAAALRHRGEHRRHPPRPGERAAGGLPAARHEPDRRRDRQRHLPLGRRACPSRSRCSPPSGSTIRSSACTTTPRPRPSTSSASSC